MELNIKQEPELQIDINTNENTPIFGRHSSANGEDHIMSQLNLLSQKLKRMEATQNDRLNKIEMGIQSILNMLSDGRVAPQTPIDSIKRVKMDDFQKFNTLDQVKLFDLELQDEDYFNKMVCAICIVFFNIIYIEITFFRLIICITSAFRTLSDIRLLTWRLP